MRNYEVAFIAQPDLDEASLTALLERTKGWITAAGGQIAQVDQWGRRKLAYPIHKQTEGHYVFIQTQLPATATREIERSLRLTEQVLRFMIIRADE
jgi:small subunit ribosomal protein S6